MERPGRMPRQITMNVTKHRIETETAITQTKMPERRTDTPKRCCDGLLTFHPSIEKATASDSSQPQHATCTANSQLRCTNWSTTTNAESPEQDWRPSDRRLAAGQHLAGT